MRTENRWSECFCSTIFMVSNVRSSPSPSCPPPPPPQTPQAAVDPHDPFGGIGVKPVQRQTEPLKKPPKWLRRPCAANFGVCPSVCLSVCTLICM